MCNISQNIQCFQGCNIFTQKGTFLQNNDIKWNKTKTACVGCGWMHISVWAPGIYLMLSCVVYNFWMGIVYDEYVGICRHKHRIKGYEHL